jgi:integrase
LDEKTTFGLIGRVPVLCVAYDLALRIGEAPLLRTETLNFDTGDIEVTRLKHKGHSNKYMLRLDEWCLKILRNYVEQYEVRGKLFPTSVMWINTMFRRRRNALNLSENYKFHCLRHSRITHIAIHELEKKGFVDELSLSRFAGHLRTETTRMYVHLATRYLAFKSEREEA